MKIAIIGGGWLGCHIAAKLKKNHSIKVFEKHDIFNGASYYNQNRLHKGFHYSRNYKTRQLCYETFQLFLKDYPQLVDDIPNNYYVVPQKKSLLDFKTFKSIYNYEGIDFEESSFSLLSNIEGAIIVDEKYINPVKAKQHFSRLLSDSIIYERVQEADIKRFSKDYDLVLNVTNNTLLPLQDHYYELSLTLIYRKVVDESFGSITMVDGPLFSIYPYRDLEYTVTDVEYTPMYKSLDLYEVEQFKHTVNAAIISNIKAKIEEKILHYYGGFKAHFEYSDYYTSIKVKKNSESADRSPTIIQEGNVINCVTGKIQGIYTLENYIRNEGINW